MEESPRNFPIGQPVRHRDDDIRLGYVVAMLLSSPYLAMVRWRSGESTFEPLDALIEIVGRML